MRTVMDKRREELEEQKAELHLALLMDEYAERMGKQAREEAEAAYERGELKCSPELDAAFHKMLENTTDAKRQKKPMHKVTRYALVAAAAVVLLIGTLVIAQAAGLNVIGRLASWTDSVFQFKNTNPTSELSPTSKTERSSIGGQSTQDAIIPEALCELNMPQELAPTWLPKGYEIVHLEKTDNELEKNVVVEAKDGEDQTIIIVLVEVRNRILFDDLMFQKAEGETTVYDSRGRRFYLFQNGLLQNRNWVAAWYDGSYMVTISGLNSEENLKKMIDSMGEYHDQ